MAVQQFKLPDLGEGLTEGDILAWTVAVGDTVEVNDTIAEVETVKAAVELPSPFAGVVTALHAEAGETVPVGTPIISIDVAGDAPAAGPADAGEDLVPGLPGEGAGPAVDDEKQMTLVGYGPREETGGRRRRRRPEATVAAAQTSFNLPPASAPHPAPEPAVVDEAPAVTPASDARHRAPTSAATTNGVLAKPPVRKLAKDLGVDLTTIAPTGPQGIITRDDVHTAANGGRVDGSASSGQPQATTRAAGDHSVRETRVPIKGVRKHTAAAMVGSAFTAPHVTEFITVDVTATMELRDRIAGRREFRDVKVSPLLLLSRAVMRALATTPEMNATWDDAAQEIVLKHYVNLGIAAATERGLIVPNIKDAHELSLLELARAMAQLTDTARSGKTTPAAMSGGTFTISNVGVFGVDNGTPILNPGESGILAFGAVRRTPWVVGSGRDERIEPRWVTQLAVSFDHRIVDGQQGSQFLADVAEVLNDPGLALL
ncbi:dihydrolipoamide acetyltransferase family protein [uncultured Jatrophihabitans sp.]|uniref:dihydrolipoamide acetyltransferase family protein n=1 Tax=uncultured Jatrophihabitans sp. TaxID=1610747 RepID=UPI0035CB6D7F